MDLIRVIVVILVVAVPAVLGRVLPRCRSRSSRLLEAFSATALLLAGDNVIHDAAVSKLVALTVAAYACARIGFAVLGISSGRVTKTLEDFNLHLAPVAAFALASPGGGYGFDGYLILPLGCASTVIDRPRFGLWCVLFAFLREAANTLLQ